MRPPLYLLAVLAVLAGTQIGCHQTSEAERRASDEATAVAEEKASETTLTGAIITTTDTRDADTKAQELRANDEIVAAFRLEQGDFKKRLRHALDTLDKGIAHGRRVTPNAADAGRALRDRRDLLKADLEAVERSTAENWATVRTKVDRDLYAGGR